MLALQALHALLSTFASLACHREDCGGMADGTLRIQDVCLESVFAQLVAR